MFLMALQLNYVQIVKNFQMNFQIQRATQPTIRKKSEKDAGQAKSANQCINANTICSSAETSRDESSRDTWKCFEVKTSMCGNCGISEVQKQADYFKLWLVVPTHLTATVKVLYYIVFI